MSPIPVLKLATLLGGLGALGLIAANGKRAWAWFPALLAGYLAVAFLYRAVHVSWVFASLRDDPPWLTAALLAVSVAVGASGAVRAASWPGVVLVTALFGDLAAAAGLVLAEKDEGRRARLVLAASGASLLTPWSGASVLAMGHGSWALSGLGLGLAALGLAGGGGMPTFHKPNLAEAGRSALVPLYMAVLTWMFMLGGVPDRCAGILEGLPIVMPGHATVWTGMVATIFGALGYEPGVALFGRDVLLHGSQLHGAWAADAMRIGASVGGGLPLLLLTKSKLTIGLPLWVAQVLLALGFLWVRYAV